MQGNWKNKLEQWAPEPPAGIWERISEDLAAEPQPLFAQKLYQFSETPSVKTWEAISAQLDAPVETPVIKLFSKNKMTWYGSVAASVLILFFVYRQVGVHNDTAGTRAKKLLHQQTLVPLPREIGVLGIERKMQTIQKTQLRSDAPNATAFSAKSLVPHIDKDPMPTIQAERTSAMRIYEIMPAAAPDLNDGYVERYIVMPVAEDVAVRLPKRLYDLFRCGQLLPYNDCAELMARIRQQSATPSFVATTDFPGLLEVVQQSALNQ